jgi:hypothetical protein
MDQFDVLVSINSRLLAIFVLLLFWAIIWFFRGKD